MHHIHRFLTLAVSLLLSPSLFAYDEAKVQAAVDGLLPILAPRMKTLDRDVLTFHYESSSPGFTMLTQKDVFNRMRGSGERFFNGNVYNGDMAGVGFYLAIDASSSRSFGGSDPHLYVVPLKKGTRLLNVSGDPGNGDLDRAKKIFADLGCNLPDSPSFYSTKLDNFDAIPGAFRNSKSGDCRQAIINTLAKLNVQAILYSYSASSLKFGCRDRGEAMNLLDSNAIRADRVAVYTNSQKIEGVKMGRYIAELYRMGGTDFSSQLFNPDQVKEALPKSITEVTTMTQAFRSWTRRNIFKCGAPWVTETDESNNLGFVFAAKLKKTYADSDVQAAEIAWMRAWKARQTNYSISSSIFSRINQIELESYRAMGLASDLSKFDRYKEAVDVMEEYSTDHDVRMARAAALLEEKSMQPVQADPNLFTEIMKQMPKTAARYPGLYPLVMKTAGAGPRMIRAQFNTFAPMIGGTVLLTKEIPYGDSKADFEILEQNQKMYVAILNKCAAVYKDTSQSIEQISGGPCGVRQKK